MLTILNVVGARPNLVKIAPLVRAMQLHGGIRHVLVHTGQHYDDLLSGVFFRDLQITAPDFELKVGSYPREEQIARISASFEPVLLQVRPDIVLVVGDVNSTLACARVAKRNGIPVAHVESGLRSFDTEMPEELNRVETDHLSDQLFVTEESGMVNLERENARGECILVGNVMIDSVHHLLNMGLNIGVRKRLDVQHSQYVVVTIHRPSNVDQLAPLERTLHLIQSIAAHVRVILPLHPRTKSTLRHFGLASKLDATPNVTLTDPLGYADFISLIAGSSAVITDSGGVQEETTVLGVPCITMRDNTERPSTIHDGTNVLVGSDAGLLMKALRAALDGTFKKGRLPALWDGHAAARIVGHLWTQYARKTHVA